VWIDPYAISHSVLPSRIAMLMSGSSAPLAPMHAQQDHRRQREGRPAQHAHQQSARLQQKAPEQRPADQQHRERQQAGEPNQPLVVDVEGAARAIGVHQAEAIGLGAVMERRPGEVELLKRHADAVDEDDRERQQQQRQQRKAARQERELAQRPRLRVEPHGGCREVGAVHHQQQGGEEQVSPDVELRGVRAPQQQRRQRQAQAAPDHQQVEQRMHEAAPEPQPERRERRGQHGAHRGHRAPALARARSALTRSRLARVTASGFRASEASKAATAPSRSPSRVCAKPRSWSTRGCRGQTRSERSYCTAASAKRPCAKRTSAIPASARASGWSAGRLLEGADRLVVAAVTQQEFAELAEAVRARRVQQERDAELVDGGGHVAARQMLAGPEQRVRPQRQRAVQREEVCEASDESPEQPARAQRERDVQQPIL
jgi:hypothetical protein